MSSKSINDILLQLKIHFNKLVSICVFVTSSVRTPENPSSVFFEF